MPPFSFSTPINPSQEIRGEEFNTRRCLNVDIRNVGTIEIVRLIFREIEASAASPFSLVVTRGVEMNRIWDDRSLREPMTLCEMKSRRGVSKTRCVELKRSFARRYIYMCVCMCVCVYILVEGAETTFFWRGVRVEAAKSKGG